MDDVSDLTRRLLEDGIDPGLMRATRCARCHARLQIVAYDGDRLQFGCGTPACEAAERAQPSITSVVTIQASCDGCDDATDHQCAELSNGDTVISCTVCPAVSVLR